MRKNILALFILLICALPLQVQAEDVNLIPQDKTKAVFFIYHHIGEDQYSDSNLQIEKFKEHVLELQNSAYNVMPIPDIITALKTNSPLPHHTIGISFDGAYRSTFENAVPLLLEAKLPFTIFVAPERIDRKADYYMSWKELKTLSKNRYATIGAFPYAYDHFIQNDTSTQKQHISRGLSRFREELPDVPALFSWPYGEYTPTLKATLAEYGFTAGFAQHSGVASYDSDLMALPRFSMTDQYGGLDRFRLAAHSYPFPVTNVTPPNMILAEDHGETTSSLSFVMDKNLKETHRLSCFISGLGKVTTQIQEKGEAGENGTTEKQVLIPLTESLIDDRIRMNCTLPLHSVEDDVAQQEQRWRWYGRLFIQDTQTENANSPASENTPYTE